MESTPKPKITVETKANVPVEKAWELWTKPEHVKQWTKASDDWHAPKAENDLRAGGKFMTRMEAKDGNFGFDFGGTYDEVKTNQRITYTMDDGRKAEIDFIKEGDATKVIETFEADSENPVEMQKGGWQAIIDNFKKYAESH